jgi:hypothetical protein
MLAEHVFDPIRSRVGRRLDEPLVNDVVAGLIEPSPPRLTVGPFGGHHATVEGHRASILG